MNILKTKALYFLARREYAYLELFNKLKKYSENLDEIHMILDELQNLGYLSEERYIKSYLNSKKSKAGLAKIKYNLKLKTGNTHLIDEIIKQNPIDEYAAAKALWNKKFGGVITLDRNEMAKQMRFLQNKGFDFAVVSRIIKGK